MDDELQDTAKCSREKYWEELSDSEKIERTRIEVKRLKSTIVRMTNIIYKLKKHSHNDKQILVPMSDDGGEPEERSFRNEKYF